MSDESLTFTCPTCGAHDLEENCSAENIVSRITKIAVNSDGSTVDLVYDYPDLEGDIDVLSFCCAHCGHELQTPEGKTIDTREELLAFLRAQQQGS